MVDPTPGNLVPYWRDYYLAATSARKHPRLRPSSLAGVETLADVPGLDERRVLVVNRQVDSQTAVGGPACRRRAGRSNQPDRRHRGRPAASSTSRHPCGWATAMSLLPATLPPRVRRLPVPRSSSSSPVARCAAPAATCADERLRDDFESGWLTKWSSTKGTGSAAAQSAVVHAGTSRRLSTPRAVGVVARTWSAAVDELDQLYLRPTSATAGLWPGAATRRAAKRAGRSTFEPTRRRHVHRLRRHRPEHRARGGPDAAPFDTWTKVELRYIGTTDGGAELLINDVSKGSVRRTSRASAPTAFSAGQRGVDEHDVLSTTVA